MQQPARWVAGAVAVINVCDQGIWVACNNQQEVAMRMLDDVYGADRDSFPLEQEARWRISRLEWEDETPDDGEEIWYVTADVRRSQPAPQTR